MEEFLQSHPDAYALGIYREVVEVLVKDADLIRSQSLSLMIRLTDSVIDQVARGRVGRGRRLTRRRLVSKEERLAGA